MVLIWLNIYLYFRHFDGYTYNKYKVLAVFFYVRDVIQYKIFDYCDSV